MKHNKYCGVCSHPIEVEMETEKHTIICPGCGASITTWKDDEAEYYDIIQPEGEEEPNEEI